MVLTYEFSCRAGIICPRRVRLSPTDIENLETDFKAIYKRGTIQHTTVFADGRAPYQEGPYDEWVAALEALRIRWVEWILWQIRCRMCWTRCRR